MKKKHDLNKIKSLVYENLEKLLESFEIEYESFEDIVFCKCPIHEGSDNPKGVSFSKEKKQWKCWTRGCHEENWDIYGFVRAVLSVKSGVDKEFKDALIYICQLYSIGDEYKTDIISENIENEFSSLVGVFRKKHIDRESHTANRVPTIGSSPYFESRGFLKKTLSYFEVEDCRDKNVPMYGRAVIPIYSDEKILAGYIGRSTKSYMLPKYIFSKHFKKTDYLYNYYRAIQHAHDKSCLFVVEGQGDVWRMHEAGVRNCVSIFGKELSEIQKNKIMTSGITKLVILTDNDQSGREAKVKIQRMFNRMFTLRFPAISKKDVGDMTIEHIQKTILTNLRGLY
jgi:5S rRNA maturation endonuclease (ribonuclease M5)